MYNNNSIKENKMSSHHYSSLVYLCDLAENQAATVDTNNYYNSMNNEIIIMWQYLLS